MHKQSGMPGMAIALIAGAAIGAAAMGMSGRNGKKIKRQAERAARTVGMFARDLTGMMRD